MTERFFEAIKAGDEHEVDAALDGDGSLLTARDAAGLSPMLAAAYGGRPRLAEHLGDRVRAAGGAPTLFEASAIGDRAAVLALLEGGEDPDGRADDGYTALHLAAFFGRLDVARLLLGRGADPNAIASNASRVTPLHSACAGRHREIVSVLLAHGASPNVVQQGGWTPLHAAAQNGDDEIVDLLLLRDADPTLPNDEGRTSIDLAESAGHGSLAEVLRARAEG